jgi:hypothetical protein
MYAVLAAKFNGDGIIKPLMKLDSILRPYGKQNKTSISPLVS